jgi:hypothetical protein
MKNKSLEDKVNAKLSATAKALEDMTKKNPPAASHTPTPLVLGRIKELPKDVYIVEKDGHSFFAECAKKEYAALIVKAVNAHDDFVFLAKWALECEEGDSNANIPFELKALARAALKKGA